MLNHVIFDRDISILNYKTLSEKYIMHSISGKWLIKSMTKPSPTITKPHYGSH